MATTTVRIGERDFAELSALAQLLGKSKSALLAEALELLQRKHYIARMNEGYARLDDNSN